MLYQGTPLSTITQLTYGPDAGPAGVHVARIKGPRRIDYLAAFILTP